MTWKRHGTKRGFLISVEKIPVVYSGKEEQDTSEIRVFGEG